MSMKFGKKWLFHNLEEFFINLCILNNLWTFWYIGNLPVIMIEGFIKCDIFMYQRGLIFMGTKLRIYSMIVWNILGTLYIPNKLLPLICTGGGQGTHSTLWIRNLNTSIGRNISNKKRILKYKLFIRSLITHNINIYLILLYSNLFYEVLSNLCLSGKIFLYCIWTCILCEL